ncbi:MAG: hypothetical protein AAF628_06885 [Planctomycetota bacterium]
MMIASVFATQCAVELRQQRTVLLALAALAPLGGLALCQWRLAVASAGWLLACCTGVGALLAIGADSVPGDLRGAQTRLLPRLPRGLAPVFAAKVVVLLGAAGALFAWGWLCGTTLANLWLDHAFALHTGSPWLWGTAGAAAGLWLLALSSLLGRPGLALLGLLALGVAYVGLPWLASLWWPYLVMWEVWCAPLPLAVLALAGLVAAWLAHGFARSRPGRMRVAGLGVVGVLGSVLLGTHGWGIGVGAGLMFPDPASSKFELHSTYLSASGRYAFANVGDQRSGTLTHALRVDLDTGEWKRVGEANSFWWPSSQLTRARGLDQQATHKVMTLHHDRQEQRFELVDAETGTTLATDSSHRSLLRRAVEPMRSELEHATACRLPGIGRAYMTVEYRTTAARTAPECYVVETTDGERREYELGAAGHCYPTGVGLAMMYRVQGVGRTKLGAWLDLARDRLVNVGTVETVATVVRANHWLRRRRYRDGRVPALDWQLFDPDAGSWHPAPGMQWRDLVEAVLDDERVLVAATDGLCVVMPERGVRRVVHPECFEFARQTPSGQLVLRRRSEGRWALFDSATEGLTEAAVLDGQLVACPDDDSLILRTRRELVRLRWGSDEVETLFP